MDPITLALLAAAGKEGLSGLDRIGDIYSQKKQYDIDIPWWQQAAGLATGPIVGPRILGAGFDEKVAQKQAGIASNLRQTGSEDIIGAMDQSMEAQRRQMSAQLTSALGRLDQTYGQAGSYRSGSRLAQQGNLEEAAMQQLAQANAGIALQAAGLQQQGVLGERQISLQEQMAEAQAEAANKQAYSNFIATMIPIILNKYGSSNELDFEELDVSELDLWNTGSVDAKAPLF